MVVCPKDLFSYYQILFAYIELHSKQEKKNHFVMKISKFQSVVLNLYIKLTVFVYYAFSLNTGVERETLQLIMISGKERGSEMKQPMP